MHAERLEQANEFDRDAASSHNHNREPEERCARLGSPRPARGPNPLGDHPKQGKRQSESVLGDGLGIGAFRAGPERQRTIRIGRQQIGKRVHTGKGKLHPLDRRVRLKRRRERIRTTVGEPDETACVRAERSEFCPARESRLDENPLRRSRRVGGGNDGNRSLTRSPSPAECLRDYRGDGMVLWCCHGMRSDPGAREVRMAPPPSATRERASPLR